MLSAIQNSIKDRFGSKKGLLKAVIYRSIYLLGGYRKYRKVDFGRVKRLVFVCSGNICRSPFGEAVARSHGIDAVSFGLHCRDDFDADPRAIAYALQLKFSLDRHKTRNIRHYVPDGSDLIVVMEPAHLVELPEDAKEDAQVTFAALWGSRPGPYLHDPFNASAKFFTCCEDIVRQSTDTIASHVSPDY